MEKVSTLRGYCVVCGKTAHPPLRVPLTIARMNPDREFVTVGVTISSDQSLLCREHLFSNLRRLFNVWETERKGRRRTVTQQLEHAAPPVGGG